EGLRQVILETVDEAHPDAFRRMLRLILDHDLIRFSAVLRAFDVWFGFGYDVENLTPKAARALLAQVLQYIENSESRLEAIRTGAAESAYLALCAAGFEDAPAAVSLSRPLLTSGSAEHRFIAVKFLGETALPEARSHLITAM